MSTVPSAMARVANTPLSPSRRVRRATQPRKARSTVARVVSSTPVVGRQISSMPRGEPTVTPG
jgi:hypothetical protein